LFYILHIFKVIGERPGNNDDNELKAKDTRRSASK